MTAHPAPRQDDESFVWWLRLTISMLSAGTLATAGHRLKLTESPAYFVEDQHGLIYRFEVT